MCPGPEQSRDGARGAERGSPQPTGTPSWVRVSPLSLCAGSQVETGPLSGGAGSLERSLGGRSAYPSGTRPGRMRLWQEPGSRSPSIPRGAGRARGTDRRTLPNGKIRCTPLFVARAIPALRSTLILTLTPPPGLSEERAPGMRTARPAWAAAPGAATALPATSRGHRCKSPSRQGLWPASLPAQEPLPKRRKAKPAGF